MSIDAEARALLHELAVFAIKIAGYPDRGSGLAFGHIACQANDQMWEEFDALQEPEGMVILHLSRAIDEWFRLNPDGFDTPSEGSCSNPLLVMLESLYLAAYRDRFPGGPRNYHSSLDDRLREVIPIETPATGAPVVYFHYDADGNPLYIGKTTSFRQRQRSHVRDSHWSSSISRISYIVMDSEDEMSRREVEEIRLRRPRHNIAHNQIGEK